MVNGDLNRLFHIKIHCEDIAEFIKRFGNRYDLFINDRAYFNAVAMSIMQIGELANGLTEEFQKSTSDKMNWRAIRSMRNMIAHAYGELDEETVWTTATNDIPLLLAFCNEYVN